MPRVEIILYWVMNLQLIHVYQNLFTATRQRTVLMMILLLWSKYLSCWINTEYVNIGGLWGSQTILAANHIRNTLMNIL